MRRNCTPEFQNTDAEHTKGVGLERRLYGPTVAAPPRWCCQGQRGNRGFARAVNIHDPDRGQEGWTAMPGAVKIGPDPYGGSTFRPEPGEDTLVL